MRRLLGTCLSALFALALVTPCFAAPPPRSTSSRATGARARAARSATDDETIGKILDGAKLYVPNASKLPREQVLAELLENHPTELEEVAGFAGIDAGRLRSLIRSGAWDTKSPWGVSLKNATGETISGPWLIRRYLVQREGGMTHEQALDHLHRHYGVETGELGRYFSIDGPWAKAALAKSAQGAWAAAEPRADWSMTVARADGTAESGTSLLELYAQATKTSVPQAKLALVHDAPRPEVVRAIAKLRDIPETELARYFASGAWGELPFALANVPLKVGQQSLAPLHVLDEYALALPAAKRQKALAAVYAVIADPDSHVVWDGVAVHVAAKSLGVKEKELLTYLTSGTWAKRRAPRGVPDNTATRAGLARVAAIAPAPTADEATRARSLVASIAMDIPKGYQIELRNVGSLAIGRTPLVDGNTTRSPATVLAAVEAASPHAVMMLNTFVRLQSVHQPREYMDMIDTAARSLGVDREVLASYLVHSVWAAGNQAVDRAGDLHALNAALATSSREPGLHEKLEKAFPIIARETHMPLALARRSRYLGAFHEANAELEKVGIRGAGDLMHKAMFRDRIVYGVGTNPFVHGSLRIAPDKVLIALARRLTNATRREQFDSLIANSMDGLVFDAEDLAKRPDLVEVIDEAAASLTIDALGRSAFMRYLLKAEWRQFAADDPASSSIASVGPALPATQKADTPIAQAAPQRASDTETAALVAMAGKHGEAIRAQLGNTRFVSGGVSYSPAALLAELAKTTEWYYEGAPVRESFLERLADPSLGYNTLSDLVPNTVKRLKLSKSVEDDLYDYMLNARWRAHPAPQTPVAPSASTRIVKAQTNGVPGTPATVSAPARVRATPDLAQVMRVYLHEGEARSAGLVAAMQSEHAATKLDPRFAELLTQARAELGHAGPQVHVPASFDALLQRVASLPVSQLGRSSVAPKRASDGTALTDLELLSELKSAKVGFHRLFEIARQNDERKKASLPAVVPSLHAVFEGNRGTGKTTVARLYARMLKELGFMKSDEVVERSVGDIARKGGPTVSVDAIKAELASYKGKVLVLDGLDELRNDSSNADYKAAKIIAHELSLMGERKELVVVLSGNTSEVSAALGHESFERLTATRMAFPDFKNGTLAHILGNKLAERKYELDEKTVTQIGKMIGAQRGKDFTNAVAIEQALDAAVARQSLRLIKTGKQSDPREMRRLTLHDFVLEKPDATGADSAYAQLESMVGLASVKAQFRALDNLMRYNERTTKAGKEATVPSLNAVFTGNPGTGKTTVARLYGKFLSERGFLSNGGVVEVTAKDLLGKTVGEAATLVKAAVKSAKGKVLFIDEAYALYDKDGVGYGKDALDTLVGLINPESNQDIAIVMAGYKGEMEELFKKSNPGLTRRMSRTFEFDDYSVPELGQILAMKAQEKNVVLKPQATQAALNELARLKRVARFGNGGTVNNLLDQAIVRMADRLATHRGTHTGELIAEDLVPRPANPGEALKKLDAMTGLAAVKTAFRDLDALVDQNHEREQHGLSTEVPSLNAVFTGNPGTGKTTVARLYGQLLREKGFLSDGELVEVKPQDLIGGHEGSTEQKVRELIERAQGKVLFIDEAYQLHDGGYGRKVIDALVAATSAEGNQNFAVVLAGYKQEMDTMLRSSNPGLARRFRQRFEFEDYKDAELATIMEKKTKDKGYTVDKSDLDAAVALLGRERALPNFGNAGAVENLLNSALQRQAGRLRGQRGLSREALTHLTKEDLVGPHEAHPETAQNVLDDLVGQEQVKTKIEEYQALITDAKARGVDPALSFEPYFTFTGSPGTGKTTVAKKMGKIFHQLGFLPSDEVVTKDASDLLAGYEGQTASKVEELFKSALGKTLFIDEAYKLADPHSPYAKQAVERLLTLLSENQGKVAVILAGYGRNMEVLMQVNPGLKSRFSEELKFVDLTNAGARQAFVQLATKEHMVLSKEAEHVFSTEMERLIEAPGFANYRDVETLYKRVQRKRAVRVVKAGGKNHQEIDGIDIVAAVDELLETKHVAEPAHTMRLMPDAQPRIARAAKDEAPAVVTHDHEHARTDDKVFARAAQHAVEHAHHEHDTDIARMYTPEQHAAIDALQSVVAELGLRRHDVIGMEAEQVPDAVVQAMAKKLHTSATDAKKAVQVAFAGMQQVEHQLVTTVNVQPAGTKLVKRTVCIACGQPDHDFRPVEQTFAVDEAGNHTLLETKKLPGTGW